ncbi:MAG: sulfotransferase [Planctomycetes bacterium]|nr:sulfotransferase [Planctomycetota bacterium]
MVLFPKKPVRPSGAPRFPVVFVLGLAHCGSTMLGRMLGQHPRVLSVGELLRLGPALEQDFFCTCGQRMSQCSFWTARVQELERETGFDWRRFGVATFDRLAREAGREMAFDLSKTLVWRRTRWWLDRGEGYVFLVRDSRGVIASALRQDRDLERQLVKHVKWMERLTAYARRRGERALTLHYEDLCREPERELRRLCQFLGLEFTEGMLHPSRETVHLVHSSASGYLKNIDAIRLDERWRRDLDDGQRSRIEDAMEGLEVFRGRLERTTVAGKR